MGHLHAGQNSACFSNRSVPQFPALLDLIHPILEGERHLKINSVDKNMFDLYGPKMLAVFKDYPLTQHVKGV